MDKRVSVNVAYFQSNDGLGEKFRCGSFCDIEKAYRLFIGAMFIPFSNVTGDGDGGSAHLIPQAEIFLKLPGTGHFINNHSNIFCSLPNL